jgi:hypothetical protein
MKYIKLFESYTESVAEICVWYDIGNWSINSEGLVDVDGDVNLYNKNLTNLPFNFGHVTGNFDCASNYLTNLKGCPESVGGYFDCASNYLTNLKGCPKSVDGYFNCHANEITSLEGCPQKVGRGFYCWNNQLTTLRFAPEEVEGEVFVLPNPIADITKQYLNKEYLEYIVKEQPDWRLYRKDGTLRLDRLEEMIEWGIETNKIAEL